MHVTGLALDSIQSTEQNLQKYKGERISRINDTDMKLAEYVERGMAKV